MRDNLIGNAPWGRAVRPTTGKTDAIIPGPFAPSADRSSRPQPAAGTFWQQKFKKLVRIGRTKALLALARRVLVATYYILRDRVSYREPVLPPPSPQRTRALLERHQAALEALGYLVSLAPAQQAPQLTSELS